MLGIFLLLAVDPLYAARHSGDADAEARVLAVYRAIDKATSDADMRVELRRICARESRCNRFNIVGAHGDDAWAGRRMWVRATAKGWLDPEVCTEHELGEPGQWAPTGAFGVSPAYALRFLDGECIPPSAFTDPTRAAEGAIGFADHLCDRLRACTCEARTRWWMGPGIWRGRSPVRKLRAVERQCGEMGEISRLSALTRYGFQSVFSLSRFLP